MDIKRNDFDPALAQSKDARRAPQNLAQDTRFRDILLMWQSDGVVAQNPAAQTEALTGEQKQGLREAYSIGDMAALAQKRALLNELVSLGVLTAEESELSTMQMLPPAGPGGALMSGPLAGGVYDAMMEESNYLKHLERAIEFDALWSRSDDVRDARTKLYGILQDVFG